MVKIQYSSLINAPLAAVWAFHERPEAIHLLTPPETPLVIEERSGGLETGSRIVFRVTHLKVRWVAEHTEYAYQKLFADRQVEGPFRSWYHRHLFTAEGEQTRLIDDIEFSLPGAPVTDWLAGWAVKIQLRAMFRYRHAVTKLQCESKP